jgi:PPP family 3-phenylpropionic acid transporter
MRIAGLNYFVLFSAVAVVLPHLQLFFEAQGYAPAEVGLLLGFFEIAGVAGPLAVGHLADRFGRYKLLILSCIALYAGAIVLADRVQLLLPALALAALFGFSFKTTVPLTDALVSRLMERPREQYGRVRMLGSLGFVVTSLLLQLTGVIDGSSSTQIMVAVVLVAAAVALAVTMFPALQRSDRRDSDSSAQSADTSQTSAGRDGLAGDFWLLIGILFLGRIGVAAYYSFFSIYLQQEVGISVVSGVWALGAIAEIPVIFFAGPLVRRMGVMRMIAVAFGALILRLALLGLLPIPAVVIPSQILHAFTFGFFHGASIAYINARIAPERRGIGMAAYNSAALGLSIFLGSVIGGVIVQELGFRALFLLYTAPPAVSLLLLALFRRHIQTPAAVAGVSWRKLVARRR